MNCQVVDVDRLFTNTETLCEVSATLLHRLQEAIAEPDPEAVVIGDMLSFSPFLTPISQCSARRCCCGWCNRAKQRPHFPVPLWFFRRRYIHPCQSDFGGRVQGLLLPSRWCQLVAQILRKRGRSKATFHHVCISPQVSQGTSPPDIPNIYSYNLQLQSLMVTVFSLQENIWPRVSTHLCWLISWGVVLLPRVVSADYCLRNHLLISTEGNLTCWTWVRSSLSRSRGSWSTLCCSRSFGRPHPATTPTISQCRRRSPPPRSSTWTSMNSRDARTWVRFQNKM